MRAKQHLLNQNNEKTKQKKTESSLKQQLRSQRNERIRVHRGNVLRMKADIEQEKEERRRQHIKSLKEHRANVTLEAWKKIHLLKKQAATQGGIACIIDERNSQQKEKGGGGGVFSSPTKPNKKKSFSTSPRLSMISKPKNITPKHCKQKISHPKNEDAAGAASGEFNPYKKKYSAVSHLKKINIGVKQRSNKVHSMFR